MKLYAIKINGLENPIGYAFSPLICSWKIKDSKGTHAINTSIEISSDDNFSQILYAKNGDDLDSLGVSLGISLKAYTRYYCRITVTSNTGEIAEGFCFFETGKLDSPWVGKWIGVTNNEKHPEFRKQFLVTKEIEKARLYITGLGMFEAYINEHKVGNDLLTPLLSDYKTEVQYFTYDVTNLLKQENDMKIFLGKGWYIGRFGLTNHAFGGKNFALLAELHIWYSDEQKEIIYSDDTWQYRQSIFELSDIYDGEMQNYLVQTEEYQNAINLLSPCAVVERNSLPLHEMERFPVKEVLLTSKNESVLDFGQNFAGYVECTAVIPKGTTLKLEFGEILQNGCFYHDNYRTAQSTFTYVSDGNQRIIRPHFTFFGFRYVKVSGLNNLNPADFTGIALYSAMEQTGWITTGNNKINQLHKNTLWGLKSNFLDMPTDCPQRDERLGWCGDAQVFCSTAGFLMDTRAFYHKFLYDLRKDQIKNHGKVACYLPNEFPGLSAAVWSDIAAFLPNMLFHYYGNTELLKHYYPLMRDWVKSIETSDKERGEKYLWDFGFQFGDWLALDGATEQSTFGRTDNGYVASCYYYASASMVAEAAKVLSLPEEAYYRTLSSHIKTAILQEYFTATGRLSIDTQTGYLLALRFGIYKDKNRITEGLQNRIKKDCNRIKGGFVGATMMTTVLGSNDMVDLAYDFLFQEEFPSWLYAVNLGATTIWERWNSVLSDGSISGTGMNSLNHYSYGSVIEFLYRFTAGIIPIEPGFRKVQIRPYPDIRLETLHCQFDSACGTYVVDWKILDNGKLQFYIEIPFGCTAELYLPEQEVQLLKSGCYSYTITTARNYLALYHADTPVEWLLTDSRAIEILNRHLPGTVDSIDKTDAEAMSKSLNDMKKRATLFRTPLEPYFHAIEEISKLQKE